MKVSDLFKIDRERVMQFRFTNARKPIPGYGDKVMFEVYKEPTTPDAPGETFGAWLRLTDYEGFMLFNVKINYDSITASRHVLGKRIVIRIPFSKMIEFQTILPS